MEQLGLSLVPVHGTSGSTGLLVSEAGQAVYVKRVRHGSPGHDAGLVAGDEILAVRGHRVTQLEQWKTLLKGDQATRITYARRGRLEETQLIQKTAAIQEMTLEWNAQADQHSRALRDRWFEII